MAIPSSGALTFTAIQTEFGGSDPISLNEYYAGGAYVPAGTSGTNGAVPSSGAISMNQFYGTTDVVIGQQAYTSPGTYTWVAPAGVTCVSAVAVGGGGGGSNEGRSTGGGALAYVNSYGVTPGGSYTVIVGAGGNGAATQLNYPPFSAGCAGGCSCAFGMSAGGGQCPNAGVNGGSPGGTYTGGGSGGRGQPMSGYFKSGGGGGAGGYCGSGGAGGCATNSASKIDPTAGAGGGGGGGGGTSNFLGFPGVGCNGGGVGIICCGSNGAAGANSCCSSIQPTTGGTGSIGGSYGGGGRGGYVRPWPPDGYYDEWVGGGSGGGGAVRIIWPGNTRTYPSTCTGDA